MMTTSARTRRRRRSKYLRALDKARKNPRRDYLTLLRHLRDGLKAQKESFQIAIAAMHLATDRERKVIDAIAVELEPINQFIKESKSKTIETTAEEITPHAN
jgi:hypothetical protein